MPDLHATSMMTPPAFPVARDPEARCTPGAGYAPSTAVVAAPAREHGWTTSVAVAVSSVIHAGLLVLPFLGIGSPAAGGAHPAANLRQGTLVAHLTGNRPGADAGPAAFVSGAPIAGAGPAARPAADAEPPAAPEHRGAGLLPFEGAAFYPTSQLTGRPVALDELALDNRSIGPIVAAGKMIMTLWINDQGAVQNVEVESSELPGSFAGPAIAAFRQMRFRPGELHGRPVGAIMKIELTLEDPRAADLPPTRIYAGDTVVEP